ncbi:MAG: nucleotidyltransferase family protein [Deltaproteobacteria bacterium]|nr:nucleotidyltransferase family protein [Deltaproteobacteria bacterium]
MHVSIDVSRKTITDFCRRWHISELAVFGSALRGDFHPESDVDLLVTFDEDARWTLFDLVRAEEELERIFGRKVDLIERRAVEKNRNYIRRKAILDSLETIYAA